MVVGRCRCVRCVLASIDEKGNISGCWAISFRFTSSSQRQHHHLIWFLPKSYEVLLPLIILNVCGEIGEHAVGNGFIEFYFPPIATHFFDSIITLCSIWFSFVFPFAIYHFFRYFSLGRRGAAIRSVSTEWYRLRDCECMEIDCHWLFRHIRIVGHGVDTRQMPLADSTICRPAFCDIFRQLYAIAQ